MTDIKTNTCTCLDDTQAKVKKMLVDQFAEKQTKHEDLKLSWEGASFFLNGGDYCPINPKLNVQYQGFKTNGEPKRSLTKDTITITAKYCPFCGREHMQNKTAESGEG